MTAILATDPSTVEGLLAAVDHEWGGVLMPLPDGATAPGPGPLAIVTIGIIVATADADYIPVVPFVRGKRPTVRSIELRGTPTEATGSVAPQMPELRAPRRVRRSDRSLDDLPLRNRVEWSGSAMRRRPRVGQLQPERRRSGHETFPKRRMAMNIWLDTEFMEKGRTQTVKLVSAAFVASNGKSLYVVITDAPVHEANDFVREHVLPYVDLPPSEAFPRSRAASWKRTIGDITYVRCSRRDAGQVITAWVAEQTKSPVFWAWYADYDWVAICQLHGSMVELPSNWPRFCRDVRQLADERRGKDGWEAYRDKHMPKGLPPHHAFPDAHETRLRHRWLTRP